jgi:hypothetical protein
MLQLHVGWCIDMQKEEEVVKDKIALGMNSVDNLFMNKLHVPICKLFMEVLINFYETSMF